MFGNKWPKCSIFTFNPPRFLLYGNNEPSVIPVEHYSNRQLSRHMNCSFRGSQTVAARAFKSGGSLILNKYFKKEKSLVRFESFNSTNFQSIPMIFFFSFTSMYLKLVNRQFLRHELPLLTRRVIMSCTRLILLHEFKLDHAAAKLYHNML